MKNINHAVFYIFVFLLIFTLCVSCTSIDNDLFARLLQGNAVLNTGKVMLNDPFSYTNTHVWIDHEWGSGVIFSIVLKYFGYSGLKILQAILLFLTMICVFNIIKLRGLTSTKLYNILFFFLAIKSMESIIINGIRCQCFSFFLFALFLYILEEVRINNKNKLLIILPFIMVFWANVHGGCVSGIGLILIYAIIEAINKKPYKKYLLALIPVCLSVLINPYGIEYIKFLLKATTMPRPYIAEWQSIFEIGKTALIKSKVFAVITVITLIYSFTKDIKLKNKPDILKYSMMFLMCYLAFSHIKHLPFLVITSIAFLYDDFFCLFNTIINKLRNAIHLTSEKFIKYFVIIKETIIYLFILICAFSLIYTPNLCISDYVLRKYPVKIAEFIKINSLEGKILNQFGFGSYLSYKLYPNNLIFMDGRYEEVYYDKTTENNWNFYNAENKWLDVFIDDGFPDYILIEKDNEVFSKMKNIMNFKEIYNDNNFYLYIRKDLDKEEYIQPVEDINYYLKTFFDTFK